VHASEVESYIDKRCHPAEEIYRGMRRNKHAEVKKHVVIESNSVAMGGEGRQLELVKKLKTVKRESAPSSLTMICFWVGGKKKRRRGSDKERSTAVKKECPQTPASQMDLDDAISGQCRVGGELTPKERISKTDELKR